MPSTRSSTISCCKRPVDPVYRSLTAGDVLYLLDALGHDSGYRLDAVMRAAQALARFLDHPLPSRVHKAIESGAATEFGPKG